MAGRAAGALTGAPCPPSLGQDLSRLPTQTLQARSGCADNGKDHNAESVGPADLGKSDPEVGRIRVHLIQHP